MTDQSSDQTFQRLHDSYVVEFLRRNPVVNTYLGGSAIDPLLREVDGRLRDHSSAALNAENRWLESTLKAFEAFEPTSLSSAHRVDRDVAIAQIRFLLRQHQVRRYQQRAVDTYVDEPFRGIDWQLQSMSQTGPSSYGTDDEWALVAARISEIPHFLTVAREQLQAGIEDGNTPDYRMLRRNGIESAEANAKYFEGTLPSLANARMTGPQSEKLIIRIREVSNNAAKAYRGFRDFIAQTFFDDPNSKSSDGVKSQFRADRFALGEEEYNWALKNNLQVDKTAAQLYEDAWPIVEMTRNEMRALAKQIGRAHGWTLPSDGNTAVQYVFKELSKEFPKSDAEMIDWYRQTAVRLVDYARKTGLFDVPADYKLDVMETPPPLRASIDGAAYYPAPPFKNSGVGRFYVTPTGNDKAALRSHNRFALADLAAHEGFPGHDWHYKVMTQFRKDIGGVRWLTPGAVEDSSSMWEDSMAAEGWALYAEALIAEAQPGSPNGFYTPQERLYQLRGKLYRDLRVRIDIGIHTNKMSYDDAVDLFSEIVDFLPGSCRDPASLKNELKRASCDLAEKAIFRYSKWPTQAITYRLGKDQIFDLGDRSERLAGNRFSLKRFHLLFMKQGTIPAGYFREELLEEIKNLK